MITLHFKTIDARTERPLAGVNLKWVDHRNDLIFGPSHCLPPSGDDGLIVVVGVHKGRLTTFDFTKDGYRGVSCFYSGGNLGQVDGTNSILTDSGFVYGFPRVVPISPTNHLFIIRMRRE